MLFRTILLALITGVTSAIAAAVGDGIVPPSELTPEQYPADGSPEAYKLLVDAWEQRQHRLTQSPNNATLVENKLAKRDSWNCQGSASCGTMVTGDICQRAWEKYTNGVWYNHYTSRVEPNCAAMYHCDSGNDYGNGWPGWYLEEKFSSVYSEGGCKRCGSCYFWASCRATLNYCLHCSSSG